MAQAKISAFFVGTSNKQDHRCLNGVISNDDTPCVGGSNLFVDANNASEFNDFHDDKTSLLPLTGFGASTRNLDEHFLVISVDDKTVRRLALPAAVEFYYQYGILQPDTVSFEDELSLPDARAYEVSHFASDDETRFALVDSFLVALGEGYTQDGHSVTAIMWTDVIALFNGSDEPNTYRVPLVELSNGDVYAINYTEDARAPLVVDGVLGQGGPLAGVSDLYVAPDQIHYSADHGSLMSRSLPHARVMCFSGDAMIETDQGDTRAGDLEIGDRVLTRDGGLQEILWVEKRWINSRELICNPNFSPIRIHQGALGVNTPSKDLIVSRQHRILIRSKVAVKLFDTNEVLCAAKDLLHLPGVEIVSDDERVCYVHFVCDGHYLVNANGAWAETLYLGAEDQKSLPREAATEIDHAFPKSVDVARPIVSGARARRLVHRLSKQIALEERENVA